jgi:prevent-host-death family protein
MPAIRPISDLRNNSSEISEFCRLSREPVFITKNGVGDMVVLSLEMYERQQAQLELYAKLAEAEAESVKASGEKATRKKSHTRQPKKIKVLCKSTRRF